MEHLRNFVSGFFSLDNKIFTPRNYVLIKTRDGGFAQDQANLRNDWKSLGGDMRKAVEHEQADYRTR